MKTTLELPDDLFRRAKAKAATQGITLKQLITEAVEERVRGPRPTPGEPAWRRLHGALRELGDEHRRIDARIEDAFERIDEEDSE